jgi:hypothetical protein
MLFFSLNAQDRTLLQPWHSSLLTSSKDPTKTTGRNSLVSFDTSAALSTYQWFTVPIPSPFPSGGLTVHTLHIQICVARLEVACLWARAHFPIPPPNKNLTLVAQPRLNLFAADDFMPVILWTNYFLEAQGYVHQDTILYQDNQSAILLEKNGRKSSSKRSKHLNCRFYFITDR